MTIDAAKTEDAGTDVGGSLARKLEEIPDLPDREYSGRGIVICAGGVQMFTNAWVLVWVLRKVVGCRLPIEIWHLGSSEMSSGMRDMLEGLDAKVVDAFAVLSRFPARITDGWQLKPYALIMSPFREVLMLDADNVPAIDPTFLFERPEFAETGAVFWPDVLDIPEGNPIWKECGLPAERRRSLETGQILIDKQRHGRALKAVLYMNEEAERYYKLVYGDKDTFLVAWLATGSAFSLVPHRPFADRYVYYQRDFDGNAVFQHRTNGKWRYGDQQDRSEGFVHEANCLEALAELRRRWNGRIFEPPTRSLAAQRMERLMEGALFVVSRPGENDRELELLAGWQVGKGRDFDRESWCVAEPEPGRFVLRIFDRHRVRYELEQKGDDGWVGTTGADQAIRLTPADLADGKAAPPRDFGFVRDVVEAVLADGGWSDDAADELRITLTTLCKVDPRLADDVADYAASDRAMDETARAGILDLATALKHAASRRPRRKGARSSIDMLFDHKFYVRP